MLTSLPLAFLAGLVTILNPCVLPLVPLLVASALGKSRAGPLALAAGLVTSFTLFGFTIIAFGYSLGIDEQMIRMLAGGLLAIAGVVLLIPGLQSRLSAAGAPIAELGNRHLARISGEGAGGQYLVGLLLGLVWAPCIGPTLGVAVAAASVGENLVEAFITFLIFGLGVSVSILLVAYGSRAALKKKSAALAGIAKFARPIFGVAMLLVGLIVVTGADKMLETALLEVLPQSLLIFTTRY